MSDLHDMVYKESRCEPQVLAHGFYHGRNYYVVTLGMHPCAYVDVSDLLSMTWEEQKIYRKCNRLPRRGNILRRGACGSK